MRLLRGAGARGLAAIPPRRGAIVRPLIDRSRAEVLSYLRDRALPYRDDPTLERIAAQVAPPGATRLALAQLRRVPRAVRRRAVRRLWRAASGSRRALGLDHVEAVLRLAQRRS